MRPVPDLDFTYKDDLTPESLIKVLEESKKILLAAPNSAMRFGPESLDSREYGQRLDAFVCLLKSSPILPLTTDFIQRHFDIFQVYGKRQWGEILLTSYYSPVVKGTHKPRPPYTRALYAPPKDLVEIDARAFSKKAETGLSNFDRFKFYGKLVSAENDPRLPKIVPHFTRQEIDLGGALKNQGLEMAYVEPIEAFFLQIQGSGRIVFDDKKEILIGYAGQNGMKYQSLGRYLIDTMPERFTAEEMNMDVIENFLKEIGPAESEQVLAKNPSYVFFQELKTAPMTTLGSAVTDGRTIAVDSEFFPLGGMAVMQFPDPLDTSDTPFMHTRIVMAQDTGGAIKGPGRADLYWGEGSVARRYAGMMKHPAKLYFLIPKKEIGFNCKL